MSTSRESFPVLEDGSKNGQALRQVIEGDSVAGKNALLAGAFKDVSGNVIWPVLSPQGALYVDTTAAGTDKRVRGTFTPASGAVGAAAMATIASLTMTNGKSYTELFASVACRRDAYFQLVYDNGTTKVVLMDFILGPGQYTVASNELHFTATAAATGTNALTIQGYCFDKDTDMFATLSCVESA